MTADSYFVVDVRSTWLNAARHPFVTLWGPGSAGYVYSLDRAGRYAASELTPGYHYKHTYGSLRALERYPVACAFVERLAMPVPPHLRELWRDVKGPVLLNCGHVRTLLRTHRLALGDPSAFDKRREVA